MTLDLESAIKHCEEVAENQEQCAEKIDKLDCDSTSMRKCASEHRQLAEWLRELKARRRIDKLDHIIRMTAQYQMPDELDQMRNEIKELEKYVEEVQNES